MSPSAILQVIAILCTGMLHWNIGVLKVIGVSKAESSVLVE